MEIRLDSWFLACRILRWHKFGKKNPLQPSSSAICVVGLKIDGYRKKPGTRISRSLCAVPEDFYRDHIVTTYAQAHCCRNPRERLHLVPKAKVVFGPSWRL